MSATVVEQDNEWLPSTCPSWCNGVNAHEVPLAEGCGWYASQAHSTGGGLETLAALTFADRPVRDFGGGWDIHVEQRAMENGGYEGPPLIHVQVSEPGPGFRTLELTTGEALILARHLMAMVDRIEA